MEINAETLRKIRDARGMTQKEFAKLLDISFRSLQDYEGGKVIPEAKKLLIISKLDAENVHEPGKKEEIKRELQEPEQKYQVPDTMKEATVDEMIARKVVEILRPFLREKTDEILVALKDLHKMEDEIKSTVMNLHIELNKVRNKQEATLRKANEVLSKSEETYKKMEDTYNKVLIIEERH